MPEPKESENIEPEKISRPQNDDEEYLDSLPKFLSDPTEEMKKICSILSGGEEDPDYYDRLIPKEPSDWKGRLDYWADLWARYYKLDSESVKAVYHRCDEIGWIANTSPWPTTGLDQAIAVMEPGKALELFKKTESLEKLRSMYIAFQHLTKYMFEPFSTLPELANLTAEFISFQEKYRGHIIKTGFPNRIFHASRWFDWHLGRLYYLKAPIDTPDILFDPEIPSAFHKNNPDFWKGRETDYYLIWVKEAIEIAKSDQTITTIIKKPAFHDLMSLYRIENGKINNYDGEVVGERCEYKDAPYFDFIEPDMAKNIERLRDSVFDIRLDILSIIFTALRSKKPSSIWEKCWTAISDNLNVEEVKFLLDADRLFMDKTQDKSFWHPFNSLNHDNRNAGLSDLIHVIGHFEKELTIGTIHQTKTLLGPIIHENELESYFHVVYSSWQNEVDDALCIFEKLREREEGFYLNFQSRVDQTIKRDTGALTSATGKTKPSDLPEPWLYDPDTVTYSFRGIEIDITPALRNLLKVLLENFKRFIPYEELFKLLYKDNKEITYDVKILATRIQRLKDALPDEAKKWVQNKTAYGYGIFPLKST